jgi:hypothetical protein
MVEMGGTWGIHKREANANRIWMGKSDKDTISRTLVIDGNIQCILQETEQEGVDWIHLAQDRDQWQGLAHMIMKN